uniref:DUF1990 domain-containing protein n=1 Tax=Tetradesmus obliquus TaxID=3088 RepID=A0A383WMU3_TETOB|eukprot:jgi/Sobl393_1/1623/SZX78583.1
MFFVSFTKPTRTQQTAVCSKGSSLGFNFNSAGGSLSAPPLPAAAQEDGWWNVDHERIKVGYGKRTYEATKDLLCSWGHFQLPWAQVDPATPIKPGSNVCVTANVFGLWTAVPLQIVYKQEGRWSRDAEQGQQRQQQQQQQHSKQQQQQLMGTASSSSSSSSSRRRSWFGGRKQQRHGQQLSYAHACLHTHYLAGEERFRVEWDKSDDSVWYDILTYSRPHHPLAFVGYPVVRLLQAQFRQQSMRAVARAAAVHTVDASLDDVTRKRVENFEAGFVSTAGGRR